MAGTGFAGRWQDLVTLAEQRMHADLVPGLQLGVVFGPDAAVSALGIRDVRRPQAVDDATQFRIASITKTFTATVLVQLSERGIISLDDPVRRYVPEFALSDSEAADRVTIRHLLLHTGGWVPHLERVADTPYALAEGARTQVHAHQVAAPGAVFSYNGVDYMVAGRVIEVAMKRMYEDAIRSELLWPLGMAHTKFTTEPDDDIAGDHTVVDGKADHLVHPEGGRWGHPSGGLRSTAHDLLLYARCHFGETDALSAEVAAKMAEPLVPLPPPREAKALAWFVRDIGRERLLMHLGGAIGQQSLLALSPTRRFALVVLTNSAVGSGVHAALLTRALETFLDVREPAPPEPIDVAFGDLAEYEGRFTYPEADVILTRDGESLSMQLVNKGPYAQRPTPPPATLRFWDRDRVVGSGGFAKGQYGDFLRDAKGRVAYFRWSGRARPRLLEAQPTFS